MTQLPIPVYSDPLDILRRFVSTPFASVSLFGGQVIKIITNDRALLPPFPLLEIISADDVVPSILWKLVRDPTAPGRLEPSTAFTMQGVSVVFMGPACLIAADHERSQVFAFVGSQVDNRAYREAVLPTLSHLSRACQAFQRLHAAGHHVPESHSSFDSGNSVPSHRRERA